MAKVMQDNLKMKKNKTKENPTETQIEWWLQACSRIYEPITIHLVVTTTGSQCRILYIKTKQGHCGKSGRENVPSSSLQRTAFCYSK